MEVQIFHSWHVSKRSDLMFLLNASRISRVDVFDLAYLAYCYEAIAGYLSTVGNDPFIAGLPSTPNTALAGR